MAVSVKSSELRTEYCEVVGLAYFSPQNWVSSGDAFQPTSIWLKVRTGDGGGGGGTIFQFSQPSDTNSTGRDWKSQFGAKMGH